MSWMLFCLSFCSISSKELSVQLVNTTIQNTTAKIVLKFFILHYFKVNTSVNIVVIDCLKEVFCIDY
ncbi:hypothetical protein THALO_240008 [Tenacibaculum halocynthiae]